MNSIKSKLKTTLLGMLCGSSLVVFGVWRYLAAGTAPVQESALVTDGSRSAGGNCDCLKTVAMRALRQHNIAKDFTFSVIRTGDQSSALEPVLVAEYPVVAARQMLERSQTIETNREHLLQDLMTRCQQWKPTDRSPIFKAVVRGIEHLRAKGCGSSSDCILYVTSDLEELTEERIRQAMKSTRPLAQTALPAPLDNAGIRIVFLGVANTIGRVASTSLQPQQLTPARPSEQMRRVEEVWRRLFTQPALVSFEPFCGAQTTPLVPTH